MLKKRIRRAGVLIGLAALSGMAAAATRQDSWDFEGDEPGRIARGFTGEAGRWEVAKDGENHVWSFMSSASERAVPHAAPAASA